MMYNYDLCEIGEEELNGVIEESREAISISLSNNLIDDSGARIISQWIKDNHSLKSINLENNNITDNGAEFIIDSLKVNHVLREVKIDYNSISNDLLREIEYFMLCNLLIEDCESGRDRKGYEERRSKLIDKKSLDRDDEGRNYIYEEVINLKGLINFEQEVGEQYNAQVSRSSLEEFEAYPLKARESSIGR